MDFQQILDLFQDKGLHGLYVAVAGLVFWILDNIFGFPRLISQLFYKVFATIMKRENPTGKFKDVSESDLLNHGIFNYINFWIYSKIPTFEFSSEYRTLVFRKYLTIYLKKHREVLKKFVEEKSYEQMDENQIWNKFLSLINEIIYDYETEMISIGIPKVIIEKMKSRNNERVSLIIELIHGICNSPFYNSDKNYLKVFTFLNTYMTILNDTITSSVKVCDTINGQLKGMSMDGKTEP
jgi:hypothetical protein